MIILTSLNGKSTFAINYDRVETVESAPDTVISLESGRKYFVKESFDEVIDAINKAKRKLHDV
ncbi:MAG: flagellar FlbD family protein [Oscillospiraceae bacterium]|nr:flagellar FlbD family protein [Oscillospiraceae bacterium]